MAMYTDIQQKLEEQTMLMQNVPRQQAWNVQLGAVPLSMKLKTIWAKFRISYFTPLTGQLASCHNHF